jgi:hypothetical protein
VSYNLDFCWVCDEHNSRKRIRAFYALIIVGLLPKTYSKGGFLGDLEVLTYYGFRQHILE